MERTAKCKICHRRVNLVIDDSCPIVQVEAWVGMATCDRCRDYRERMIAFISRIERIVQRVEDQRGTKRADDIKENSIRSLRVIMASIAQTVSDHYLIDAQTYDASVVDRLIENWRTVRQVVRDEERRIRSMGQSRLQYAEAT